MGESMRRCSSDSPPPLSLPPQEYYDKGEYVIRQGEEGSTFYIIAQGKVKLLLSKCYLKDITRI